MSSFLFRRELPGFARALVGLVVAGATFGPAVAQESESSVTGTFALTTDYRFRGISQTDGPAVQGGITWAKDAFSLGVWGSSTEFSDQNLEIDLFGGYTWSNDSGVAVGTTLTYYMYPGDSNTLSEGLDAPGYDPIAGSYLHPSAPPGFPANPFAGQAPNMRADFLELGASVGKTWESDRSPSLTFNYAYSPDYFGEDDTSHMLSLTSSVVMGKVTGKLVAGYQDVSGGEFSSYFFTPDGYDWTWLSLGLAFNAGDYTLDFTYHWVDNGSACGDTGQPACDWNGGFETFWNDYAYASEGGTSYRDLTESQLVFTISRSF